MVEKEYMVNVEFGLKISNMKHHLVWKFKRDLETILAKYEQEEWFEESEFQYTTVSQVEEE